MKEKLMKAKAKFKAFVQSKVAKMAAMVSVMTGVVSVAANAEDLTAVDFAPVAAAVTSNVTVAQILTIVALCISSGIGFVVVWMGARKISRSLQRAIKTGKLSF